MARWEKFFSSWIYDRGLEYHRWGRVVELEDNGTAVQATVYGSRAYQVEIRKTNGRVANMSCDCPYAAGGENCKHMAAVLIALDAEREKARPDWRTALEQLSVEQLRELLDSFASENGKLQDRIVRMVSGPGNDPAQWQDDLEQIISDYTDYHDFIDYNQAYDCMVDIASYLEESLPSLLAGGHVVDGAKLVMTVYGTTVAQDMDDSDGGSSIVIDACQNALAQVLAKADEQQERKIYSMLYAFLEDSDSDYGADELEDMILSLDWSAELQQKNLEWLDENLDSWRMQKRAALMERMGATAPEMIAWWEQYRENDSAYRPLLQLYEEHDLVKAISLVKEKRARETSQRGLTEQTKTLLRLLERAAEQEQYESELRHLVMDLKCQDAEYLARLKELTPSGQWTETFGKLLAGTKGPTERMHLYHFEGMYSELFTELTQYPSFVHFQRYETELRGWDPERTLKLFIELLKQEMDRGCDRMHYRNVIRFLSALKAYPDGQEAARALADDWYVCHRNRPAMKDELRIAGYPQRER